MRTDRRPSTVLYRLKWFCASDKLQETICLCVKCETPISSRRLISMLWVYTVHRRLPTVLCFITWSVKTSYLYKEKKDNKNKKNSFCCYLTLLDVYVSWFIAVGYKWWKTKGKDNNEILIDDWMLCKNAGWFGIYRRTLLKIVSINEVKFLGINYH